MAGIQGLDELEDFADAMKEVSGKGQSDGIQKARRDALRATLNDFIDILTKIIKGRETSKGGTLDSRTSPYDSGGSNESDESTVHMADKEAWESSILGNDIGIVMPKPDVTTRARWLEHGTADHGPRGDTPMYFHLNGATIVVADPREGTSPFGLDAMDDEEMIDFMFESGVPGEVEGVDRQNFFKDAVKVMRSENIFKENMERELNKEFEEHSITVQGDW